MSEQASESQQLKNVKTKRSTFAAFVVFSLCVALSFFDDEDGKFQPADLPGMHQLFRSDTAHAINPDTFIIYREVE